MPGKYEVQGSFSFLGPGTRASAPETVSYGTSEQALLLSGCKMEMAPVCMNLGWGDVLVGIKYTWI